MSTAGQGSYCVFCGSLLDGGGRFCGTCGKPSDAGQHEYPPGGPTNPRSEPLHPGSPGQPGEELGQPAQRWDGRRWLESDANVADAPGQQEGGRKRGLSDATRSSGAGDLSDQNVVAGNGEIKKAVDSAFSMPKWIVAIFVSVFLVVVAVIVVNVVSPGTGGDACASAVGSIRAGTKVVDYDGPISTNCASLSVLDQAVAKAPDFPYSADLLLVFCAPYSLATTPTAIYNSPLCTEARSAGRAGILG